MTSRPVQSIGQFLYLHLTTYLKSTKMAYYIRGAVTRGVQGSQIIGQDLQAENGDWLTVLDHAETYLETSVVCFVCAAFRKALRAGLLDSLFEGWPAAAGPRVPGQSPSLANCLFRKPPRKGIWLPTKRWAWGFTLGGKDRRCEPSRSSQGRRTHDCRLPHTYLAVSRASV